MKSQSHSQWSLQEWPFHDKREYKESKEDTISELSSENEDLSRYNIKMLLPGCKRLTSVRQGKVSMIQDNNRRFLSEERSTGTMGWVLLREINKEK